MKFKLQPRQLATAALLATLAAITTSPGALAHDEVIATTPVEGEVVQAGVIDISLTYSAELMEIDESAEIIVIDPNGELVNNGCAIVKGSDLYTKVDIDAVGTYSVTWRAVSGDGHPIEGGFAFELENKTNHESSGIVAGTECAWAISALIEVDDSEPDWIYLLLWLILPFAGVALYFLLRPRPKPAGEVSDG